MENDNPQDDWQQVPVEPRNPSQDDWQEVAAKPTSPPTHQKQGLWQDIKDEFAGKRLDASGRAQFKSMGLLGGLTSDAAAELVTRLKTLGKEGLGLDEWKKAAHGDATPLSTQMENAGVNPYVAKPAGFVGSTILDPMNALFGGVSALEPAPRSAWSAVKMNVSQPFAPLSPIASGLKGLGKKIYGLPFKPVNADVATKYKTSIMPPDSTEIAHIPATGLGRQGEGIETVPGPTTVNNPDTQFSDYLWNKGDPKVGGFSKSNTEISDQITQLKKAAGEKLGEMRSAEGLPEIDMAPDLEKHIRSAQDAEAAEAAATDPEQWLKDRVAGKEQEPAKDWLMSKLADKRTRQQAGELLKKHAPQFSDLIDRNLNNLSLTPKKSAGLDFFDSLMETLFEGPRTVQNVSDLASAFRQRAEGSTQLQSNQFQKAPKYNEPRSVDAATGGAIAEVADDAVMNSIPDSSKYKEAKRDYGMAARGEIPAQKVIQKAISAPPVSKTDVAALLYSLFVHKPAVAMAAIGAKGSQLLNRSPRIATGTGMLLNDLGKTNIWDAMARRSLIPDQENK